MAEHERMLDKGSGPPEPAAVDAWLGPRAARRWAALVDWIDASYPGVFSPDWLYGGQKHGWALRYKKGRSFCILVPERGRVLAVIVLGKDERAAAEPLLPSLSPATRAVYESARTFADGKWLGLPLVDGAALADAQRLLALKRRPGPGRAKARPPVARSPSPGRG